MPMERGQFPPWGQAAPLQVRAEVRIAATKLKRPTALFAARPQSASAALVGSIARATAFAAGRHGTSFFRSSRMIGSFERRRRNCNSLFAVVAQRPRMEGEKGIARD